MKVRMKVQITGLRNNVRWPTPGGVVEVGDVEGAKLCANGFAEPVVEDRVEKATPQATVETRTGPDARPTKRAAKKAIEKKP